jgi:hypothetical protein
MQGALARKKALRCNQFKPADENGTCCYFTTQV